MYKILLFILLSISIKSFSIPPTLYNITGGGYYCSATGSGIQIGLSGSQSGVSYQLLRSGTIIMGTPIVGTGSQIVFPNQTVAGTYTIKATNTLNESSLMNGSSVVSVVSSTTLPGIPGTISGATDACLYIPSDTLIYKTTRSTNTTSYLWTVPSGASIIGNNSDTFIRVKYSSSFTGTLPIKVSAINACYNNSIGSARSLTIYKRIASTPGVIQKSFSPSVVATSDVCDVIYDTFMIRNVPYATSYIWSITTTTGTIRKILGSNDTAIRLYFSADFVKDTLSVRSVNACSVSLPRTLALTTQRLPPTPIAIVSGPGYYNPCVGYYITFVAASPEPTSSQHRTSMYHWTIPRNTSIVSAYYDSSFITVLFGVGYTGGAVTVRGETPCGQLGSSKSQAVTLGDCSAPNLVSVGNYIYPNVSGGTPPYTCSLNNGPFQPIDTFKNLSPGNYTILIKDFNGCTKPINVALYDSIRISSFYYNTSNKSIYINSNASGTLYIRNSLGVLITAKAFAGGALRAISVSTLTPGTYTATAYDRVITFTL